MSQILLGQISTWLNKNKKKTRLSHSISFNEQNLKFSSFLLENKIQFILSKFSLDPRPNKISEKNKIKSWNN